MPIRDVGDAMREMKGGSRFIKTRPQAIAVGLKAERRSPKGFGERGFGSAPDGREKKPNPFSGRKFGRR